MKLQYEDKVAIMCNSIAEKAKDGHRKEKLSKVLSDVHAFVRNTYRQSDERLYMMDTYVRPARRLVDAIE